MALPNRSAHQRRRPTPIQTDFNGYRFRSRLEARWGVFFETLGLQWEYEPEGFELEGGVYYLPDFRVTSPQGFITWYEVKAPSHGDASKLPLLQKQLNASAPEDEDGFSLERETTTCVTLEGDPYSLVVEQHHDWAVCPRCGLLAQHAMGHEDNFKRGKPSPSLIVGCWPCDITTPSGSGNPLEEGLLCYVEPYKGWVSVDNPQEYAKYANRVALAATRARRARFEHGETP